MNELDADLIVQDSKSATTERAKWWRQGLKVASRGFNTSGTLGRSIAASSVTSADSGGSPVRVLLLHFSDILNQTIGPKVRELVDRLCRQCTDEGKTLRVLLFSGEAALLTGWETELARHDIRLFPRKGSGDVFALGQSVNSHTGDETAAIGELSAVLSWLAVPAPDINKMPRWLRPPMRPDDHAAMLIRHVLGTVLADARGMKDAIGHLRYVIEFLGLASKVIDPSTEKVLLEAIRKAEATLTRSDDQKQIEAALRTLNNEICNTGRSNSVGERTPA